MNKNEKIMEDVIERFLIWAPIHLKAKKDDSPEGKSKHSMAGGCIDEQLHIIRKYATKEQMLRIKEGLGKDFNNFF